MEFTAHFSFDSPENLRQLLFHPALNTVFGCSNNGRLYCFDTTSGNLIKWHEVSDEESRLLLALLPSKDRLIVCHGRKFNARTELNGTLLLESILQTKVNAESDLVTIDLSHVDAVYLLSILKNFDAKKFEDDINLFEFYQFLNSLEEAVTESEKRLNLLPTKLTRWETVSLKTEFSIWKATIVVVLKNILPVNTPLGPGMPQGASNPNYQDVPGLPVVAAIMDRLQRLGPPGIEITQQGSVQIPRTMNAEVDRRATFTFWPHMDYKWALPDQMAQAGFFQSSGSAEAEDRALCFICRVCLVCWESTDEPWAEHERHSENCPFVKGQYTHNIPIRVTHGTETAVCLRDHHSKIIHLSSTNSHTLIATAGADGEIIVWDLTLRIRQVARFNISKVSEGDSSSQPGSVTITSLCLLDVTSPRAREMFVHEHLLIVGTVEQNSNQRSTAHLYSFEIRQVIQVLVGRPQFLGKYSQQEAEIDKSEDEGDPPSFTDSLMTKLYSKDPKHQHDQDYIMGYADVDEEIAGIASNTGVEVVISSESFNVELDVTPPITSNSVLDYVHTGSQSQRSLSTMEEWNRLNYCLGKYRCSGHCIVESESDVIVKQIMPYPGTHRHPSMFICLFNATSQSEEFSSHGGIIVFKGVSEELSRVVFMNENTPIQACPIEPDPCDPDVTPSTSGGGVGDDSDDAIEPVPPKKTKSASFSGEDHIGMTSCSSVVASGCRLPSAVLAVVTAGGDLAIIDVQRCENNFAARYVGNFTCIEFCSGMDRICAASSDGKVHFMSIGGSEVSDENNHPELGGMKTFEETVSDKLEGVPIVGQSAPGTASSDGTSSGLYVQPDLFDDPDLLVNSVRENLGLIHELIQYEPLVGRVHVSLPPCWSQMEREEHQTAPSNIGYPTAQMINLGLGSSPRIIGGTSSGGPPSGRAIIEAFVGSWKLTPDGSTWREHVMEIVFPKVISVGHIDLKFRLQDMVTGNNIPQSIYVTLLRQNVSSQTSPSSLGANMEGAGQSGAGTSGFDALITSACMQQEIMSGAEIGLTLSDLDAPFIDEDSLDSPGYSQTPKQPPPISESQLRQLNAEVIAGPYRLSDYIDLSGQVAVIPLTSVDLMKVRTRFYAVYIHTPIKEPHVGYRRMVAGLVSSQTTMQRPNTKQGESAERKAKSKVWGEMIVNQPSNFQVPHLGSASGSKVNNTFSSISCTKGSGGTSVPSSTAKATEWYGCDIIRQITLTIHRFKRIQRVPRERLQRMAILRNNKFHVHLVDLLLERQLTQYNTMRVLDILNWIVVMYANDIHMKRSSMLHLLSKVIADLNSIVRYCLIGSDRSTAKKVAKFLLQLLDLEKNGLIGDRKMSDIDPVPSSFHTCLLDCLMNNLPLLLLSDSPAGVRWFFFLLGRLGGLDIGQASQNVACMIRELARLYRERTVDLNLALLRSDFGIFSNPLDPVLFDIDASTVLDENRSSSTASSSDNLSGKPQSTLKAGSSPGGWDYRGKSSHSSGELFSNSDLLKDLLPLLSTNSSYDFLYDEADWRSCGLTETEPLHFTCHTSSSDTKLERGAENMGLTSVNVPQPSQHLEAAFEPFFLTNTSPLYKAKQHQLMKLHLKKQLLEAKLTEAKKAVQQQHLQALQTLTNSVQKPLVPLSTTSNIQGPWHIPSTPQTTPAATTDTTPKHCTPSVSPPNEGSKPGRSGVMNGPGTSRVAAAAAAAAMSSPLIKSVWCQHLLSPPAPHEIVMERNHGGARRFVVLDFGRMVYLTDVIIPANEQLSSLSVDAWLHYEDIDGQRLAHVTDIATHPLILSDLQPPTVCRFLKITVCSSFKVATLTQRSRVQIGNFYGHSVPHPEAINTCASHPLIHTELEAHIQQVAAVLEDNRCRYGLARDLLRRQLRAYYPTTTGTSSSASNPSAYSTGSTSNIPGPPPTISGVTAASQESPSSGDNAFARLKTAVQHCFVLQRLVNFSQRTLERLQRILSSRNPCLALLDSMSSDVSLTEECITKLSSHASTDKIRVLLEACLSYLLYCQSVQACDDTLSSSSFIQSLEVGQSILQIPGGDSLSGVFKDLIAFGTKRMQIMSCCLLSDLCCVASITKQLNLQGWLAEWLGGMLRSFFAANSDQIVPRSRIFLLICLSLQRLISSGLGRLILTDLLKMLEELLSPLKERPADIPQPYCFIDQELLNWMVLLTTKALDFLPRKGNESEQRHQPRWEFLSWHHRQKRRAKRGISNISKTRSHASNTYGQNVYPSTKSIGKNTFATPEFNPKLIKRKLHKRLLHHREQLMNLTKSQEDFLNVTMAQHSDSAQGSSKSHFGGKEAAKLYIIKKKEDEFNSKLQLITKKHVKDMLQLRKNDLDICRRTKRSAKESFTGVNSKGTGTNATSLFGTQFLAAISSLTSDAGYSNEAIPCSVVKQQAIPVVRLLFTLLCRLDTSCSTDTFLRTCKLIGHIMRTCQPQLHLSEALHEDAVNVLLHRFASASLVSSFGESWAGPYGLHAVACLFSDLLDSEEEHQSPSVKVKQEPLLSHSAAHDESSKGVENVRRTNESHVGKSIDEHPGDTASIEMDFLKQIDLFESDESDSTPENKAKPDDYTRDQPMSVLNDRMAEDSRTSHDLIQNVNVPVGEIVGRFISSNFSSAYDCRLEHGLEWRQEIDLMRYMAQAQVSSNMTLVQPSVIANPLLEYEDENVIPEPERKTDSSTTSAKSLLSRCINDLICRQRSENLHLMPLLQMWLLLNQRSSQTPFETGVKRGFEDGFSTQNGLIGSGESDVDSLPPTGSMPRWVSAAEPTLSFTRKALGALLVSLTEEPHPLSVLHMGLRVLVLTSSQRGEDDIVPFLLTSPEFKGFLIRLLSVSPSDRRGNLVGPATLDLFEELLLRLRIYCTNTSYSFAPFVAEILNKLMDINSGPLFAGYGPIDLQCKWVLVVCEENFSKCDTSLLLNLVFGITQLAVRQLKLLTPSLTPHWSCSSNSSATSIGKENQNTKLDRGIPPPYVCFTSVCSSSGVLTKNDPDKAYEALCNRDRLVTALMSLLHHIVASSNSVDHSFDPEIKRSQDNRADEQKILDTHSRSATLADVILGSGGNIQPVQQLLRILSLCMSNVFTGIGADLSLSELAKELMPHLQPRSIGDWTLLTLKQIYLHCTARHVFLDALLTFLSSSPASAIHEPLLLLVAWILTDETSGNNMQYFLTNGGLRRVAYRFVELARYMIGTQSSCVRSTEIDLLTGDVSSRLPLDEDSPANLAPVCVVKCTSGGQGGSSSGSESLLQSTQAIHRRVKCAQWSYNFFPDESYTELYIRVPSPALLSELIVVPHLASLQSSPSAISFELHLDEALVYSLSGPVQTAGMPQVRITLPPTLANGVVLRLHRPCDVDSVGLSHIQLRGYSLFSAKLPHSDGLSPAFAWLRLLHFVLDTATVIPSPIVSPGALVGAVVDEVPALLPHLCAQITSSGADHATSSPSSIAESVLLNLGRLCPQASLHILRCLLKIPMSDERDLHLCPLFYQWEGVESNTGTENLIYRLTRERDEWMGERLSLLLQWLGSVSTRLSMSQAPDVRIEPLSSIVIPSLHIGCIAVVLWEVSTIETFDGSDLVTEDLVNNVYNWYLNVGPQNPDMRRALACLMCSFCALSPNIFSQLLDWTKVSTMIGLTDDSKSIMDASASHAWPGCEQLEVLAVVSQSPACLPQLYSSGFLELLTNQLLQFVKHQLRKVPFLQPWGTFVGDIGAEADFSKLKKKKVQPESLRTETSAFITTEGASAILQFLTQIMESTSSANDWLGSAENTNFWKPLIALLMIGPSFQPPTHVAGGLADSDRISLEQAAIEYFVTVTRFSEVNQTQFSQIVCNALLTLASQVSGRVSGSEPMEDCSSYGVPLCLPSFLRRLILQVMLDEGRVEVLLRASTDEDEDLLPRQSPAGLNHPELGAGYGRYIHQGVATETLATVAEKLLRRRSMLGSLLSGSKGSSCTTIAGQTLLTNVSNMGPNEEKISVLPTQGLSGQLGQFTVSDFHTTTQALQLLDQISTSAGLNINMQKKDAAVSSDITEKNNSKTSGGTGKVSHSQSLHVDASTSNNPTFFDGLVKFEFMHKCFGDVPLPLGCTLGQVLIAISLTEGYIPLRLELTVRGNRFQKSMIISQSTSDTDSEFVTSSSNYSVKPTPNISEDVTPLGWCLSLRRQPLTTLDTFAAINGLSALAELLHLLVPGICRLNMAGGSTEVISDLQKRQSSSLNVQSSAPQIQAADHCLWEDFTFSSDIDFDPYSDYMNSFISMTDLQSQVMIGASTRPGRPTPCPQGTLPALPAHTLIAFALFLRLNGYADLLLNRERRLAICLLRLMMGVTEDANGDSLLTRGDSRSLPQLPFTVLCQLLRTIPHGTDDAAVLQKRCLDLGIVELCLSSLAILSHQEPVSGAAPSHPVVAMTVDALQAQMSSGRRKPDGVGRGIGVGRGGSSVSHPNSVANTEQQTLSAQQQQKLYWAKGTGFGTGSTVSSWDAEQTLLRQRMEEEHCTAILHVLAAFIRPGPDILECSNDETSLPAFNTNEPSGLGLNSQRVLQMFQDSCLVAAMASYLRNDSVLDMARHVSLYRALLVVLRSLALDSELRVLLRIQSSDSSPTNISNLLASMKRCVDTYAARLKVGTKVSQLESDAEMDAVTINSEETIGDGTGLAQLIPDIQKTADLVEEALRPTVTCSIDGVEDSDERLEDGPLTKSSQDYCTRMKPLQFDTFKMIREKNDGSIVFVVPHFHSSTIQHQHMTGTGGSVSRSRRLAQETVTLSTSLPLSESSSVFVRCDEDRLDVMKALITGPLDTPYANGCFEFDVYFPSDYPKSPPQVQLKTTGNQTVRFNPNLYNCGKVCLSILNTWHGRPEEKWSGKTSSFLQVLVSIQSLILVSEPYFNEPGYERSRGTPCGTIASRDYDANIRQATVRWAMLDMLRRPPEAFRQVVQNHFYLKKEEILKQVNDWITEMTTYTSSGSGATNATGSQGPPPPPPPGTPSSSSLPITIPIPTVGSVPSAVTNSVAKHSLIQLKKYFSQLQEELNKLSDPAESSPDDLEAQCDKQQSVDEVCSSVGTSTTLPQTSEMKIMSKGFDVVDSQMPPQSSQSIDEEPNDEGIIL